MNQEKEIKEIQEAIYYGNIALESLGQAKRCLESAGNWGFIDMFGGGFFTTMAKHSKINDAQAYIQQANNDLRRFTRELNDIHDYVDMIQIDGFISFADYFFDNVFVDYMVQSKINESKNQVQQAMDKTQRIIMQLKDLLIRKEFSNL